MSQYDKHLDPQNALGEAPEGDAPGTPLGNDALGNDAAMDRFLSVAMPRRPEPRAAVNLAVRAIERAKRAERLIETQRRQMIRRRLQLRIASIAAVVIIGLILVVGAVRIAPLQASNFSWDSQTLATDTSTSGTDSGTVNNSSSAIYIGGALLILAMAGLAAERAMSADRLDPASLIRM